jgi:hypothetical protein
MSPLPACSSTKALWSPPHSPENLGGPPIVSAR